MFIKKDQTRREKNTDYCTVFEYDFPVKNMSVARVEITGPYPTEGWAKNLSCDQLMYGLSGNITAWIEDQVYDLEVGDAILIRKKLKYRLDGRGECLVLNQPAWLPDQYRRI